MRFKNFILLAMLVIAFGFTVNVAKAVETPFEADVGAAIDDGLQYLRSQSVFTSSNGSARQARALAVLALLEKRADFDQPVNGYSGSSSADKALARDAIQLIMNDASYGVRSSFSVHHAAYHYGETMMALSFYAKTGGPEVANIDNYTLRTAIDRMVNTTIANQATSGFDSGFWLYSGPGDDSSTTQFCVAGLAAAKGITPGFLLTMQEMQQQLQKLPQSTLL